MPKYTSEEIMKDRHSLFEMLFINALGQMTSGDLSMHKFEEVIPDKNNIDVKIVINGFEADLKEFAERFDKESEEWVKKEALKLMREKLNGIYDTLNQADYKLKEILGLPFHEE